MKKTLIFFAFIAILFLGFQAYAGKDVIYVGTKTDVVDRNGAYNAGAVALSSTQFISCSHALGSNPDEGECALFTVDDRSTMTLHSTSTYVDQERWYSTYNGEVVCKLDTDKFVVVYADDTLSDDGYTRVGSVSGDTITGFGTAYEFETGDVEDATCVQTDTDQYVVFYNDETNSDTATAAACTASGTTITCGTPVMVGGGTTDYLPRENDCAQLDTDKFVCMWTSSDLSNAVYVAAGTVGASDVITWGTAIQLTASSTQYGKLESPYLVTGDTDRFAITVSNSTDDKAWVTPATVSGTTITLGTDTEYQSTDTNTFMRDMDIEFYSATGFLILGRRNSNGSALEGLTGTIDWGTRVATVNPTVDYGNYNPQEGDAVYVGNGIGAFVFRNTSGAANVAGTTWYVEYTPDAEVIID